MHYQGQLVPPPPPKLMGALCACRGNNNTGSGNLGSNNTGKSTAYPLQLANSANPCKQDMHMLKTSRGLAFFLP